MKSGNQSASAFGARLRQLMQTRGHVSAAARSGVDVAALSRAAAITYEMARRYAEGLAIPRPDKLAAIAQWLGVAPGALAWGNDAGAGQLDERLLQSCIEAATEAQQRTAKTLTTEAAAHLVALLYQEAAAGSMPAPSSIDLLVKSAAR